MMRKKIKAFGWIVLVLVCMMAPSVLDAKHIVGGDVTYKFVRRSGTTLTFEITFTMYRDSEGNGAEFDEPAVFGLFRGSGNDWTTVSQFTRDPISITTIDIDTGNPCLEVPPNIGVESGVYRFEISFTESATESYMVAYQRCCRNNTINNIIDPQDTGAVFSATISPLAQAQGDNSPTFDDFPPVVICANSLLNFDHSATDVDGDQIVYSFCTPLTAGGTDGVGFGNPLACTGITPDPANCGPPFDLVQFNVPAYTFADPLGNGVTISQSTGLISGVPQTIGQFVVGVCAITYRNGIEISRLTRDFQFNVTNCEVAVQARIDATKEEAGKQFIVNSCGENTVDLVNLSSDQTKIFSYLWQIDIGGDTVDFTTRNATFTFPDTGQYLGKLFLNNEGAFDNCKDTADIIINIFPEITADFEFDYDTCVAGPIDLTNLSVSGAGAITANEWTFEDGAFSTEVNPIYLYDTPGVKPIKLAVEDRNECRDSIVKDLTWFPVPPIIVVEPNSFIGCVPSRISFDNLSAPIDSTYDIIWDFGDGTITNELSPSHLYTETGTYSVSVDITSPIGCQIDDSFSEWIRILESPVAGFSYSPEQPSIFNKTVEFFDESENAVSWLWNLGGVGSLDQNPTYTFPDTGRINVLQVVTHLTGCTDTAAIVLDILPLVTLHVPNAFTPNNDGLNDTFKGKGFFDGFQNYEMTIWNRWGELLYQTNDPDDGWNGQKNNSGPNSPIGTYVYAINYTGPRGEIQDLKGHVTLIR